MTEKISGKCVIFGDREITDYSILIDAVTKSGYTITEVISGEARGADTLGEQFAQHNNLPCHKCKPDWDDLTTSGAVIKTNSYGKQYNAKAGFDRNQIMADMADFGIGLQNNGDTRGTQDMKDRLQKQGKPVYILGPAKRPVDENDDRIPF
jgi:hypothetical protein